MPIISKPKDSFTRANQPFLDQSILATNNIKKAPRKNSMNNGLRSITSLFVCL